MGTYGEGQTKASETAAKSEVVKAKDVGRATIIGATETEGLYGPQLRLRTEGGQTIYIPTTSGLAKGIMSGKLTFPLVVSTQRGYGPNGPYSFLGLAPRAQKTLSGGA